MIAPQGIVYQMPQRSVMTNRPARFKNHRRFIKNAHAFRELQEREHKKH